MAEQRRTCASCGTANEEDARFCEGCGASFARTCATCGVEARATARFCRACGAPLDGQAAQQSDVPAAGPVRKTVTVLFADLAGSTSFEERVDAETAREVIGRYHDLLRMTAHGHRAGVTKYIGDGFMAVWGVPEIRPDDAVTETAHVIGGPSRRCRPTQSRVARQEAARRTKEVFSPAWSSGSSLKVE